MLITSVAYSQKSCCPKFSLVAGMQPCPDTPKNGVYNPNEQGKECTLSACKHTTNTYTVVPYKAGYTYQWQITGGTPSTATGNPMAITWGNSSNGSIKVFVSSIDGTCRDTITQKVCLKDAPTANFLFTPSSPVCLNQLFQFTNSSVGAVAYYWDFGDGTSSTQTNPTHIFTTPGTYTIMLAVSNAKPDTPKLGPVNDRVYDACGCTDTIRKTIVVKNESGINIISGCKKMLCKGDTANYCTTNQCNSYSWSVTGGHILGSSTAKCVNVIWDGSYPATVTLASNCAGTCGNANTLNVPVLFSTMPIQGSTIVCPSSFTNYSLPSMPGTFYNWTISSGGIIIGANINTSNINVQWGSATGSYTINCNYKNSITGCSGSASTTVQVLPPYTISGPIKYCVGNPFTFNANGNGNWTIQPSTGFTPSVFAAGNAINGVWNAPGNYTITAIPTSPSNFCSYPATLNVVVIDTPKLNPIVGPVIICPSSTLLYSISSNINDGIFNWTITGGNVLSYMGVHNDSVMITWNNVEPYKISVNQIVSGCSSSNKVLLVDVYPPPTITVGPITSCMDNMLSYTASGTAPVGGYNWSLSNSLGTIISGQGTNTVNILWHGTTSNINTCTVTVATCSGTDTRVVTIVPTPAVTITKAGMLCSVNGITLTASISNGTSYVWQYNGVTMPAPNSTQNIFIHNAGVYTVTITTANGCKSIGTIIIPTENLTVAASISTIDKVIWGCTENINALLHATPAAAGYCYQWYIKPDNTAAIGIAISGATAANYTATGSGLFWCEVKLCNTSCIVLTNKIYITKNVCGGGNGTCDNNYTASFSNTNCNPTVFTATTNPAAAVGLVHWYFGDGDEGYGSSITHQFRDTGSYNVCAFFGAAPYCQKNVCKIIKVGIAANFSAVANCDKVAFTNLSKSISPLTYNWSFTGGTPPSSTLANPPLITYATGGLHTASVTINDGTCSLTYSDTFTTYSIAANMNVPTPICAKTEAPFTASCTTTGVTYKWNFGDGFISNLQNTTHAYASTGTYTVTLVVTNQQGCTKTLTQVVTVLPELHVSIGVDKFICPGSSTTLTATPSSFASYQWYKNGVAILGATSATYNTSSIGEYWVAVANGNGCTAISNHANVLYSSLPIAHIIANSIQCTASLPLTIKNSNNQAGVTYSWSATGPAAVSFSPANSYNPFVSITGSTPGAYQFILIATDNTTHCVATDTMCITLVQSPTVTIAAPTGTLCEGHVYTFTANALPNINPESYQYHWNNGVVGNTLSTGNPGVYQVTVQNPSGCIATAMAGTIKKRPDVSLFPVGCDTLCWTDTLRFPLPQPATSAYTVTWFDNDGTAIANVGSGIVLPLANLQPGIHHLYATVSFAGGCADTTGMFDLYIKDCTLLPPCDNCTGLFQSASLETASNPTSGNAYQISNNTITITILKPVKEVRISLADLKYYWKDTTCNNCKVQMIERGCLFAASANQSLGTLLPDSSTAVTTLQNAVVNKCSDELVWKNGTLLQPGTYTIPLQLSLPKTTNNKCILVVSKFCLHITLIDEQCKTCDTRVCVNTAKDDCKCGFDNSWTSLYLVPKKVGIAKPHNQILCNSVLTDVVANIPYTLSGLYHCQGKCASVKNEIAVYNQLNQIIYTHVSASLNETIVFPTAGMYSISLTANCGTQKCICTFRTYVTDGTCADCTTVIVTDGGGDGGGSKPPIDSVINSILPPDFNGEILVAKNDTVLYEKYVSFKDKVTSHTAFDLASITKTFTAMAVLKLMEDGKLNIDEPVFKYLPEFPTQEVTIKMLLSHTSGLEDYLKFMDESDWDKTVNVTNKDLLQFIVNHKSKVLINTPGKVFNYSNTNFAMLSLIIEKVSGLSYKDYLSLMFFKPLQMNDTYVLGLQNFATATKSYYKNGKTYGLRYLDLIYGDKNVYSTVQDLRKWDKALKSGKLFKKATLDLAYAPASPSIPYVSNYGLGWKKIVTTDGKEVIYHTGWWAGSRSLLIRLIKENVIIAVVSNNNFTNINDIKKLCDLFGNYQLSKKVISNF